MENDTDLWAQEAEGNWRCACMCSVRSQSIDKRCLYLAYGWVSIRNMGTGSRGLDLTLDFYYLSRKDLLRK